MQTQTININGIEVNAISRGTNFTIRIDGFEVARLFRVHGQDMPFDIMCRENDITGFGLHTNDETWGSVEHADIASGIPDDWFTFEIWVNVSDTLIVPASLPEWAEVEVILLRGAEAVNAMAKAAEVFAKLWDVDGGNGTGMGVMSHVFDPQYPNLANGFAELSQDLSEWAADVNNRLSLNP